MSLPKKLGKLYGFSLYVFRLSFYCADRLHPVAAVLVLVLMRTFRFGRHRLFALPRQAGGSIRSFKCFTDEANSNIPTSDANANLFFSPPEIPLIRPGIPMTVSAQFFKLSWKKKYGQWLQPLSGQIYFLKSETLFIQQVNPFANK